MREQSGCSFHQQKTQGFLSLPAFQPCAEKNVYSSLGALIWTVPSWAGKRPADMRS